MSIRKPLLTLFTLSLTISIASPNNSNAEQFSTRAVSAKLVSTRQVSQKEKLKDVSSWHISQDPDKAKGDPYTAMSCLFNGQRRVFCPENGLGSFSISKKRGRILAWGAGAFHVPNWGKKIVAVLDLSGEVLKVWETTGTYAFRGRGISDQDVLVVAYQTHSSTTDGKGIVHVRAFDFEGKTRWHTEYPDTFLSDFGVASDASFSVLLLGSRTRGGKSLILDSAGKLLHELGPAASFSIAHDNSWVLLWDAGKAVVFDPKSGHEIFKGDFSVKDRNRIWYAGASSDAKRLIVLESTPGTPQGALPEMNKIRLIDLSKREISVAALNGHGTINFSSVRFDAKGRVYLTFGTKEFEYEIAAK